MFYKLFNFLHRFCELRQPNVGAASHPGHERLPDRHEAPQGAAQAAQERRQALLGHQSLGKLVRAGFYMLNYWTGEAIYDDLYAFDDKP